MEAKAFGSDGQCRCKAEIATCREIKNISLSQPKGGKSENQTFIKKKSLSLMSWNCELLYIKTWLSKCKPLRRQRPWLTCEQRAWIYLNNFENKNNERNDYEWNNYEWKGLKFKKKICWIAILTCSGLSNNISAAPGISASLSAASMIWSPNEGNATRERLIAIEKPTLSNKQQLHSICFSP